MARSSAPRARRLIGLQCACLASLLAPGAAVAHEPPSTVLGISSGLGLADVTLDSTAPAAVLTLHTDPPVRVPMLRGPLPGDTVLRARVMAGVPRFRYSITLQTAGGDRTLGPMEGSAEPHPADVTPDWAKGAVWYQIFVERFRNGEPANDPAGPDIDLRPWNEPWHAPPSADQIELAWFNLEAARAAGTPGADRSPAAWRRAARRYGGDLQGIAQQVGALRDLGIDALYLNPIFRARTSHKYDAADFRHIDETFAIRPATPPDRDAALRAETPDPATWVRTPSDAYFQDGFLPAAHYAGLRVILDGVWNHVGRDFWAFKDLARRGSDSAFTGWFDATFATGDPLRDGGEFTPGALIGWRAWDRWSGGLPAFARTGGDGGNLAQPVRDHVFAVTRRWMNPAAPPDHRIDGWRLDVAPDVPRAFWPPWRALVKALDPDALIIGEIWYPAAAWFHGAAFDGQMNYPFAFAVMRFLCNDPALPAPAAAQALAAVLCNHPATDLVQQNLLGSHDTARAATMFHDPSAGYDILPRTPPGRRVDRHARPGPNAYACLMLALAIQATFPGGPMVYYGDEVGMYGANDPDCRKPYPWPDAGPYADDDPVLAARVGAHYRAWLGLRHDPRTAQVLRLGAIRFIETGSPDVLCFQRRLNDGAVLVVINRATRRYDADGLLSTPEGRWHPVLPARSSSEIEPLEARCWLLQPPR